MDGNDLLKLREKRAEKAAAAQTLQETADDENRDLTELESEDLDGLLTDTEECTSKIRSGEDEIRRARLATQQAALAEPSMRRTTPPQPSGEVIKSSGIEVKTRRRVRGALRSFQGKDAEANAYMTGMWFKAQLMGDDYARHWCGINCETRILTGGSNISAGYLIPPEFEAAIITNREEFGVIRQWARVIPMSRDTISIPKYETSPTATWVSEGGSLTAADPTFSQVQLTAKKLSRLTRMSSEMMDDSAIDLADWLAMDMAQSFAEAEDDAALNGDGTSTYGGISGLVQQFDDNQATYAGAIQNLTSADTFAEVVIADVSRVMAALPQYAEMSAAFYISRPGFALVLERIAHAGGGATVQTFESKLRQVFMGYPVRLSQKMPTSTGSLDNLTMMLFGDLARAVVLGDRRQITLQVLTELYAATDEIGLKATERVDIAAHGAGDATTAGPIVAMIGTS